MNIDIEHNGKTFSCFVNSDSTGRMVQAMALCHNTHTSEERLEAERKACKAYDNRKR